MREPTDISVIRMRRLIERSSLGTPHAKVMRSRVPKEEVDVVLAKYREIRDRQGDYDVYLEPDNAHRSRGVNMPMDLCVSHYTEIRRVKTHQGIVIVVEWEHIAAHPLIMFNNGVFINNKRYLVDDVMLPSSRDSDLALAPHEVGFLVLEVEERKIAPFLQE